MNHQTGIDGINSLQGRCESAIKAGNSVAILHEVLDYAAGFNDSCSFSHSSNFSCF
jgi:hypothetical protein